MIEQINRIAEVWLSWMWPMFWQVGVLITFVGAVDFLLRKRVWPQIRYALWLLILVKLILPPTFSLSTSIVSHVRKQADRTTVRLESTATSTDFSSSGPAMPTPPPGMDVDIRPIVASENIPRNEIVESTREIVPSPVMETQSGVHIALSGKVYLMVFWLMGIVVLTLWAIARFRNLRRVHNSDLCKADLPHELRSLAKETAGRLHLRKLPAITLSETIPSPAVFGTFKPVLVLPATAIHHLSHRHIEHILLHELAHIKRGDLVVNTIYTLLQIVYWFNPLLWLIRRRLHHLRELCCDATVARILREDTLDYRDTILETAKRFLPKPVEPGIGLLGLFETSGRLLVRLKWLEKKTWKHRGVRFAIICIVVGLMLVCVLPMAKAKSDGALTVAADGSGKYSSIQEAIDAAGEGEIIRIGPGTYEESLEIDKPLTLEGAGWDRTTVKTQSVGAFVYEEAMRTFNARMQQAQSDEQRKEIATKFEAEFKEKVAKRTLLVSDTEGVVIRDLKLTSPGKRLKGRSVPVPIVEFNNAKASVSKCVVIGSPGDGICILNGSDVEIRDSLIAAVWGTGITVGDRQGGSSSLRLLDSALRNCHYAGICIRRGNDLTRIERCRISGAAWHGIRYDDCSPTIMGNRVFGNARCGIYASGQTGAIVKQNLFYANEMTGMSCWFQNRDTIQGNTFTGNQRAGLSVLGASKPIIRENIFFSEPNGVYCGDIGSKSKFAVSDGSVTLQKNLFWHNEHNAARGIAKTRTTEEMVLDKQAGNVEVNPKLAGVARSAFSLMMDSPARGLGIGVAEPIECESPWPLQPEEMAIIPDGRTRDYRQWKTPAQSAPSTQNSPVQVRGEASPVNPSDIALLYHRDRDVRILAVQTLGASNNPEIIDDLIRAHSVEDYTPVHNAYGRVLQSLTGYRHIRGKGAWKAWLAREVRAGRLKIEYLPVEPADGVQSEMIPFVLIGQDGFDEMSAALTAATYDRQRCYDALRYMVFNDHLPQVKTFLFGNWLNRLFAHRGININDVGYVLNGLANPGPLRDQINTQVCDCLDSSNPIVAANALNLIAGVEGFSTRFVVPGVEAKVTELTSNSVPEIALQAKRALARIKPGKMAVPESTITEVKDGLHIMALIDGKDTIKINSNELWYEHHSYNLPGQWWNGADNIQYDEPTYINGTAWKPEWQARVSKPYRFKRSIPLKENRHRIKLTKIIGRGSVSISEMPHQANDYTLSILLDDNRYDAAQWYEFMIQWGQSGSQNSSKSSGPVTNSVKGFVTDKMGRPRENVYITTSLNKIRDAVRTDENGRFILEHVQPERRHWMAYSRTSRAIGFFTIPQDNTGGPIHVVLEYREAVGEGRVVGADGKGLAGRKVELITRTKNGAVYSTECYPKTDEYGNYHTNIPSASNLTVQTRLADADEAEKKYVTEAIPLTDSQIFYPMPMLVIGEGKPKETDDGKVRYSGRIINEQGQPISGVKVDLSYRLPKQMSMMIKSVMTGADGQWQRRLPKDLSDLTIGLLHPEYIKQTWQRVSIAELLNGTNDMVMKRGLVLSGVVKNQQGEPVVNVLVDTGGGDGSTVFGEVIENCTTPRTLPDGSFRVGGLAGESMDIVVSAIGYAPQVVPVEMAEGMRPIEVRLKGGRAYTGRVIDVDGHPVEGVKISLREWEVNRRRKNLIRLAETDAQGHFTIQNLPNEGKLSFYFSKRNSGLLGFRKAMPEDLSRRDEIVMYKVPVFVGKVIDAETEEPIRKYTLTNGIRWSAVDDEISWSRSRHSDVTSEDGTFRRTWGGYGISYPFDGTCDLRVSAKGYLPEKAPSMRLGEEYEPCVVRLTKGEPRRGLVVDAEGHPAVKAEVGWVGPKRIAFIKNGKFDTTGFSAQAKPIVQTDSNGRFELPPSRDEGLIVALHKGGYASVSSANISRIQLTPWAKIEGTVIFPEEFILSISPASISDESQPRSIRWMFDRTIFSGKSFTIDFVPSIPLHIGRVVESKQYDPVYIDPQPGQTYEVQFGGKGVSAAGKRLPSLVGTPLPDFTGLQIDFTTGRYKGQKILVCFWDVNQRPSRNCIRQLGERVEQFEQKGMVLVAVQASQIDQGTLDEWIKEHDISFPIGTIRNNYEKIRAVWGIESLPWMILTDKNQMVQAEGLSVSELDEVMKEGNQ